MHYLCPNIKCYFRFVQPATKYIPIIHPDFYKNLKYFRSLFPQETTLTQVINTGEEENDDSFCGHINYLHIFNHL